MFDYLPRAIASALENLLYNKLYEIRIRANRPIVVNYGGQIAFLSVNGVSEISSRMFIVSAEQIREIVLNLCERSVYAYTDKIRQGYISMKDGVRIGICGECVLENDKIINISNISSMNIRIPHSVKGCSKDITKLYDNGVKNTLIISPPGAGKTTFVRDIAENLSEVFSKNILVCDERNEIFPLVSSSLNIDCITYGQKKYAFENGIRAMSPDAIITDEVMGIEDAYALYNAYSCGVNIIATIHGRGVDTLIKREEFTILKTIFELFVFLGESQGKGTIEKILFVEEIVKNDA